MPDSPDSTAVIIDGGPGGLAAAWAAFVCSSVTGSGVASSAEGPRSALSNGRRTLAGPGQPALIVCLPDGPRFRARRAAAERQAQACGAAKVIELHAPPPADGASPFVPINEPVQDGRSRRVLSHVLLDACLEAMQLGLSRVVWPVHSGATGEADLKVDVIADACDRSLLVGQLASLDAPRTGTGSRGVRLETPYSDLTDAQIVELLIDMGAPISACWWCEADVGESVTGCASCASCRRWAAALKRTGAGRLVGAR